MTRYLPKIRQITRTLGYFFGVSVTTFFIFGNLQFFYKQAEILDCKAVAFVKTSEIINDPNIVEKIWVQMFRREFQKNYSISRLHVISTHGAGASQNPLINQHILQIRAHRRNPELTTNEFEKSARSAFENVSKFYQIQAIDLDARCQPVGKLDVVLSFVLSLILIFCVLFHLVNQIFLIRPLSK